MTICQHLTGVVRTEKRTKNVSGKGVVYQNNALNINLMYSCCLLYISLANSAAIVKRQSFSKVELSLHCYALQRYSVTALQLKSSLCQNPKRKFIIYNIIYYI